MIAPVAGQWNPGGDEAGSFQFGPEVVGDGRFEPGEVLSNLIGADGSGQHSGDGGMGEWELDGGGRQRDPEALTYRGNLDDLPPLLIRDRAVMKLGIGDAFDEAAVEHLGNLDGDATVLRDVEKFVQRVLVEQGVAAGQEEDVEFPFCAKTGEHRRLGHADPDGLHDALPPEVEEGREGFVKGGFVVVVRIVDEEGVEAIDAEAVHGCFDRAKDTVAGEVVVPATTVAVGGQVVDEAANLGGEDELVARDSGQGAAEAEFGEAIAVHRRGVVGADAVLPGGEDRFFGLGVGDAGIGEGGAAESDRREVGVVEAIGFEHGVGIVLWGGSVQVPGVLGGIVAEFGLVWVAPRWGRGGCVWTGSGCCVVGWRCGGGCGQKRLDHTDKWG